MADSTNRAVCNDRYVYRKKFVEKQLFNELYVRKLLSVYKRTSSSVLYSDVVKFSSKSNVPNKSSSNITGANKEWSKFVKINDKCTDLDHNKVSRTNVHSRGFDTSDKSVVHDNSIDSCTNSMKVPYVVKQSKKVINTSDQDCFNVTETNRFAVLYVDSSEDEGDSLDSVTVKDSVLSCNDKEFQSGRTVGMHDEIGKKISDFCVKTTPSMFTWVHSSQNKENCQILDVSDINSPRTFNTKAVVTNGSQESINTKKVTETVSVGDSLGDKYGLQLHTTLKGDKIRLAKNAIQNEKFMTQNNPMFGFIPIYGLKGRVYDRHENNICQNIMELHQRLRNDGRHNYVGLQIPVSSKLNPGKWANYLHNYWDWQLPLLVKYGFPIDFDRNAEICHELGNHNSANQTCPYRSRGLRFTRLTLGWLFSGPISPIWVQTRVLYLPALIRCSSLYNEPGGSPGLELYRRFFVCVLTL